MSARKCATIGCMNRSEVVIAYRYRDAEAIDMDLVCRPCAASYANRPALVDFKIRDIAPVRDAL